MRTLPRWRSAARGSSRARHAAPQSILTQPSEDLPMADLFTFPPDRKALVTGGASGIGLGAAKALRATGARVAIADLPGALDRMEDTARNAFLPVAMDVTDDASVAAGVATAAA